jgi:flagellar protein FlbD
MIRLTRISHLPVVLNSDLIEHIETTPDTVISLVSGQKVIVLESADEVIRRVIDFRRSLTAPTSAAAVIARRTPLRTGGSAHAEDEAT